MFQKEKINKNVVHEVEIVYLRPASELKQFAKCADDSYHFLLQLYDKNKLDYKEFFYVLLLNKQNQIIGVSNIGKGSVDSCAVNIKEIFQLAIKTNATGIIVSHNHPSGSLKPSSEDLKLTKKIKDGCALFDTVLLDHVIITSEGFYSFAEEGTL